jgi:hypothetical protein
MLPRVRLRQKTEPPTVLNPSQAPGWRLESSATPSQAPAVEVSSFSRKKLTSLYHYWWRRKVDYRNLARWQKRLRASQYNLRSLSVPARQRILACFRADYPSCQAHIDEFVALWTREAVAGNGVFAKGESFLLTYQGDWGVIPVPALDAAAVWRALRLVRGDNARRSILAELSGSCPSQAPDTAPAWDRADPDVSHRSVDLVADAARVHPRSAECVSALRDRLAELRKVRTVLYDAWSVEVCGRSWLEEGRVRLHLHLALALGKASRGGLNLDEMHVLGTSPYCSAPMLGAGARARNSSAGLYYAQAPKVGVVHQGGSHEPHVDYPVSQNWIYRLLSAGKMLYSRAREEMVRSPAGLPRHLEALERWQKERVERSIKNISDEFNRRFATEMQPWKEYAMVTMWLQQYRQTRVRYGFLVLDGPSRMGKTQFARSLCQAPGGVLEINMAGSAKVDMRAYDALVHDLLLFDECEPGAVLENKKLFQAGGGAVSLQTSATNLHAFAVCVCGSKTLRRLLQQLGGQTSVVALGGHGVAQGELVLSPYH